MGQARAMKKTSKMTAMQLHLTAKRDNLILNEKRCL
jgi:hypothetical protein